MIVCECYNRKVPAYIKDQLPVLFKSVPDSFLFGNQTVTLVFWEDKAKKKVAGAACLTFNVDSVNRAGLPVFDIYIERFEVKKKLRRQGIGSRMFAEIRRRYSTLPVKKYSLLHINYDEGVSRAFWISRGFSQVGDEDNSSYLELEIS